MMAENEQLTDPTFEVHRPRLFALAYRMLGQVTDAEDIVQEAFLRWGRTDTSTVENPAAYLSTIVTRLCIDQQRSARSQREQYIGPWLPEPLVANTQQPDDQAELADSLSMAFLLVLETLSPVERAVFILHEVFDYSYAEIATIVGKSVANCRQIGSRARKHIRAQRSRFVSSQEEREGIIQQFVQACQEGDLEGLFSVLAERATMYSDGGGKVTAARKPIEGAAKIAHFLISIYRKAPEGITADFAEVNGQPGIVAYLHDQPQSAWSFRIEDGKIQQIYVVLNPDKLMGVSS